jgi:hypothetical protein
MADGLITRGDPFSYLSGAMGRGSKAADVAKRHVKVKGHTRGAPTYSGGPDGKPNPAMKSAATHKMAGNNETKPGAATTQSRAKSGAKGGATTTAKSGAAEEGIKHEAGESKAYERLEDRTMRGLKGPKSKILTEGHNTITTTPIAPRPGSGGPSGGGTGSGGGGGSTGGSTQTYRGPGQIGSRVGMAGPPVGSKPPRRGRRVRAPRATGIRPA